MDEPIDLTGRPVAAARLSVGRRISWATFWQMRPALRPDNDNVKPHLKTCGIQRASLSPVGVSADQRPAVTSLPGGSMSARRLTREEFNELLADRASEVAAIAAGLPVPAPTARRRPIPAAPIRIAAPLPAPRRPAAANDNRRPAAVVPTTASTPDRIARALPPPLRRTLLRRRELSRAAEMDVPDLMLAAANSNAADDTGVGMDHRHDITPGNNTLADLLEAYADGMRTRVVIDRKGRVDRYVGGISYHPSVRGSGEIVDVGGQSSRGKFFGLRAHRGAIVAYAKHGKLVRPSYKIGDARGDDDADMPRETTASPAAHPVLAEIDRRDAFADFCARVPAETGRLLRVAVDADNFQEVARAAGMTPTAHNGRRVTEKILGDAEKLMAA